jgi:hypothetical protein
MARPDRDHPWMVLDILPWWAWALLGVASFMFFSWLVAPPAVDPSAAGVPPAVSRSWGRSLAFLAMIIVPALCTLAAIVGVMLRVAGRGRGGAAEMAPAFGLEFAPLPPRHGNFGPDGAVDASRLSLELLRALDRKRLVEVCVTWFGFLRFRVETARHGADGNVDLRLYTGVSKQAGILVQCKAQDFGEVGVKDVRELLGAMSAERVAEGIIVTPGAFSGEAIEFAAGSNIHVIDGPDLLGKLLALEDEAQAKVLRAAATGG